MCDCYMHKCDVCDKRIDMHIGDFRYPRSAFNVWCAKHLEKAPGGSVVFTWQASEHERKGGVCAVFGPAVGGTGDNHPNIGSDMTEEVVPGAPWWLAPKHLLHRFWADASHFVHGVIWRIGWKLYGRRRYQKMRDKALGRDA